MSSRVFEFRAEKVMILALSIRNWANGRLFKCCSYNFVYDQCLYRIVSFIKSITLCSPWTELRVLLQSIKIFKLYILQD